MNCCPPNSLPPKEKPLGEQGTVRKVGLHDTTLYVTGPSTAKAGLLAFPDVFGVESGRSKADCDAMGQMGYAVVLIDFTDGDYLQQDEVPTKGQAWLAKYPYEGFVKGKLDDAVAFLRKEAKVERIGAFGYCYGAWVGARFSADNDSPLQANVSFHPSWAIENRLKGDKAVDTLAERINCPQLLCTAGNDPEFMRSNGSVHKILSQKDPLNNVIDFPRMIHGWVNRGNLDDPDTVQDVNKAWSLAQKFLRQAVPL